MWRAEKNGDPFFLSTVIAPKKKFGFIDPFIYRIVDDLDACETFPWGDTHLTITLKTSSI